MRKFDTTDANTAATFNDKVKMKGGNPGPSSYNLPDLIGSKGPSLKSTPAPSFGLNPLKKSYHPECAKDFAGKDSPPLTKYRPEDVTINKSKAPQYGSSKF